MTYRKYRNKPVEIDGNKFASRKEAKRYADLKLLERAGEITDLELQPVIMLEGPNGPLKGDNGHKLRYTADFRYRENGKRVIEDVKSAATKTQVYQLRKAIVRSMGIEVTEV